MEQQPKAIVSVPQRCCNQGPTPCVCVKCLTPNKDPKPILRIPTANSQWGKSYCPKLIVSFFLAESQDRMKVSDVFRTIWEQISSQGAFPLQLHSPVEHFIKSMQHWVFFASGGLQATEYMRVKNHGQVNWEVKNEGDERKAGLKVAAALCSLVLPGGMPSSPLKALTAWHTPSPEVLGGCAELLLGWQLFMSPSSITISPFLPGLLYRFLEPS